jgi:hypothetical protein
MRITQFNKHCWMGSLVQINTNVSVESQDPSEDNRSNHSNKRKFLSPTGLPLLSPEALSHYWLTTFLPESICPSPLLHSSYISSFIFLLPFCQLFRPVFFLMSVLSKAPNCKGGLQCSVPLHLQSPQCIISSQSLQMLCKKPLVDSHSSLAQQKLLRQFRVKMVWNHV